MDIQPRPSISSGTNSESSVNTITEKHFQYDVLDKNVIRLFKLDLNDENEPLSGQLMSLYHNQNPLDHSLTAYKHIFRHDADEVIQKVGDGTGYDTFSYSWGSLQQNYTLRLSVLSDTLGKDDQVRENYEPYRNGTITIGDSLFDLLNELRRRKHNRFLWIDAICINQANDAEKSMQIPMMRDIYEYAEQGYIWLGLATDAESSALRKLGEITTTLGKVASEFPRLRPSRPDTFRTAGLPDSTDKFWQSIGGLMRRPYWSRLWCLQEVVVGKEEKTSKSEEKPGILVMCGDTTTSFKVFDQFSTAAATCGLRSWIIVGREGVTTEPLHGFDGLDEIRVCRASWENYGWAVHLGALLIGTRRRLATVPKDMVLGMLALVDGHTARSLAVDISQPTETIFVKFAKHYIRNEPKEVLLNHIATEDRLGGLPSWCPNFASRPATTPLGSRWLGRSVTSKTHKEQMYRAGFTKSGKWVLPRSRLYYLKYLANPLMGRSSLDNVYNTKNPRQMYFQSNNSNTLIAMGMHTDRISAIVDCNPAAASPDFFSLESLRLTKNWLAQCLQLSRNHIQPGASGFDILARTLVANRIMMEPTDDEVTIFDREEQLDLVSRYFNFKKFIDLATTLEEAVSAADNLDLEVVQYAEVMSALTKRRCFFATESGRVGLGPADSQIGDAICVLFYCPTPYVLRHHPNGKSQLIGEAYVHGLMYGEALDMLDGGDINETKWAID